MSTETEQKIESHEIKERGLNFRPRSEFTMEHDYLKQFLWLARPKLTRKLFFELEAGLYMVGNGFDFKIVIAPESERAAQWNSIYPGHRQRLCMIYRNKAHFEAMLASGKKENPKPTPPPELDMKAAFEVLQQYMSFASQPLADSTQAVVLVFKVKRDVSEADYSLEVARLALETIKAFEMTGKVEFLTGHTSDGDYVFCAGFEAFRGQARESFVFNARMKHKVPVLAHKTGMVKLNKTLCATEKLKSLRDKYTNQDYFVFSKGKIDARKSGVNNVITKAIRLLK